MASSGRACRRAVPVTERTRTAGWFSIVRARFTAQPTSAVTTCRGNARAASEARVAASYSKLSTKPEAAGSGRRRYSINLTERMALTRRGRRLLTEVAMSMAQRSLGHKTGMGWSSS